MKKTLVSVIIVNYNGKHLLKEAIDSVKNSISKAGIKAEIIIVDNNSSDGSSDFVKKNYPYVRVVQNKLNLNYTGINSGLPYCNGQYVLFLNNDISMDIGCIKNLLKAIKKDNDIFQVCPRLINYYDKKLKSGGTWVSRAFYNGHINGSSKNASKEIPYLGVGLIRKDFVDNFGYLFDSDYLIYGEDLDLGLRIRLTGKKVIFEQDAIIYHMHSITMQKRGRAYSTFLMERNLLTTLFKILEVKNIILYMPYVILVRFISIIKDMATLKIDIAFSRLKAIFFILSNFGSILKKRKQTQKFRTADDQYILKVFSERYMFKKTFVI